MFALFLPTGANHFCLYFFSVNIIKSIIVRSSIGGAGIGILTFAIASLFFI
jgi:hypothetical protein